MANVSICGICVALNWIHDETAESRERPNNNIVVHWVFAYICIRKTFTIDFLLFLLLLIEAPFFMCVTLFFSTSQRYSPISQPIYAKCYLWIGLIDCVHSKYIKFLKNTHFFVVIRVHLIYYFLPLLMMFVRAILNLEV